jgi:hypothetical protein
MHESRNIFKNKKERLVGNFPLMGQLVFVMPRKHGIHGIHYVRISCSVAKIKLIHYQIITKKPPEESGGLKV